ncbi:MAG: PH domain-containing protein [Anaerolineae bacterium]|nr:PH domain-containing protein [Anaerolineae bacterium]
MTEIPGHLDKFLKEEQDSTVVRKIYDRASQILTSGEEILYIAVQNKPVVNITPECVVLTTRRFIIYKPKLLGQVDFEDYIWRDLRDAQLKEEVVGAKLTLQTVDEGVLEVEYLPKAQARRVYAIAQEMEEKMFEERRERELEEKRAEAGGIMMPGSVQSGGRIDPVKRLQQLKEMLDANLISEAEYESKKADILSRM